MKKYLYPLVVIFLGTQLTTPIMAQNISTYFDPAKRLPSPTSEGILATFFQPLISLVPVIAGIASFLTILIAGVRYVTHAGNPAETKKSADMITYALVGLGLSALAFALTRLLFQVGGAGGLF